MSVSCDLGSPPGSLKGSSLDSREEALGRMFLEQLGWCGYVLIYACLECGEHGDKLSSIPKSSSSPALHSLPFSLLWWEHQLSAHCIPWPWFLVTCCERDQQSLLSCLKFSSHCHTLVAPMQESPYTWQRIITACWQSDASSFTAILLQWNMNKYLRTCAGLLFEVAENRYSFQHMTPRPMLIKHAETDTAHYFQYGPCPTAADILYLHHFMFILLSWVCLSRYAFSNVCAIFYRMYG
jgi:hypothetical protein